MNGKCLCGLVQFKITGNASNLYQCHCTLCQKVTGTSASSGLITGVDAVIWMSGQDKISSFTADNGYRTDFCRVCGSPVPNKMNVGDYMWIPAGSLDGVVDRQVVAQIFTRSRPSWATQSEHCISLQAGPDNIDEFMGFLQRA